MSIPLIVVMVSHFVHMSKFIKFYTLNMGSSFYIYYTSVKLLKKSMVLASIEL